MTRTFLATTAAIAALTLGACSSETANNTEATAGNAADATGDTLANAGDTKPLNEAQDATSAAVGLPGAALTNSTDAFVPAAAISDMFEIQSSKLALEKSKSADVKKFAQEMITQHQGTSAKLKATLKSANITVTPPTTLDARRQGMIDNLKSASAADFDKVYLDQQTNAHREAVTLFKSYADDGDNPGLKKLAAATAPVIQSHLDMVQAMDKGGADGTK
jgi:putative membrane protein